MSKLTSFVPFAAAAILAALPSCSQAPKTPAETCCAGGATPTALVEVQDSEKPNLLAPILDLEGTWVAVGEDGKPSDQVVSVYRKTAGGHAVAETIFPGQEHEMESVYFVEDGALLMVHYCMMGNRPRMIATVDEKAQTITFECAKGSKLDEKKEAHMHRGKLNRVGKDRIRSEWFSRDEKGEVTSEPMVFEIARVKR